MGQYCQVTNRLVGPTKTRVERGGKQTFRPALAKLSND